jgi:maleylacetate reductase
MQAFTYKSTPAHVLFGTGTLARLPELVSELGGTRALLLSTPAQASQVRALGGLLGNLPVAYFHEATLHTPIEITERAMRQVHDHRIDIIVALGGGSTIGLGKAIGLRTDIAQIAIPTTYAGSEMTPILGQSANGIKTTQRTLKILPRAVIYDVELTVSLPVSLSGTSGINAIAHAVEGLYAQDTNPVMQLIAEEGIRALAQALPGIAQEPGDRQARAAALYGAWLCGTVLGNVGMALHHKLCHTVGGSFNLPHAETHAIILPHAVAYNALAVPDAIVRLARALHVADPVDALFELARSVGAPAALRDLGMPEHGVEQAADEVLRNPYWNPRPLDRSAVAVLLKRAWAGERPRI